MVPAWQMEAYERLRAEIVKSAVNDYRAALRKSKRIGCKCAEEIKLERWFLSGWGQMLSGGNGEYIIEKCRKTYKDGVSKKGKQHIPDDVQKRIYQEYKNGKPQREIIKRYGISHTVIYNIVRRWEE
jgi:hypothetical protein